jgi:hypothetical protein
MLLAIVLACVFFIPAKVLITWAEDNDVKSINDKIQTKRFDDVIWAE